MRTKHSLWRRFEANQRFDDFTIEAPLLRFFPEHPRRLVSAQSLPPRATPC
jgi:hypothetical protein